MDIMLVEIAFFQIFGKPLIMYLGIITLLLFLFTASIAILNKKTKWIVSFKWHPIFAIISIISALIHGLLGAAIYFFK